MKISTINSLGLNQVVVNGCDVKITSPTWSKHYDIMYLKDWTPQVGFTHVLYHFVHVMYNEGGLVVKCGNREEKYHYIFFDSWPAGGDSKLADIRFQYYKTESEMHSYWTTNGYPSRRQSATMVSGYNQKVYWEKIASFIRSQLGSREEYWTFRYKSLEEAKKGDFLNCKLFCKKWNEELMGSGPMDSYLWDEFKTILHKTMETHKAYKEARGDTNAVLRLENLLVHFEEAALCMSPLKINDIPNPLIRPIKETIERDHYILCILREHERIIERKIALADRVREEEGRLRPIKQVLRNVTAAQQQLMSIISQDLQRPLFYFSSYIRREVEVCQLKANVAQSKVLDLITSKEYPVLGDSIQEYSRKIIEIKNYIDEVTTEKEKCETELTEVKTSYAGESRIVNERLEKARLRSDVLHSKLTSRNFLENSEGNLEMVEKQIDECLSQRTEEVLLNLQEEAMKEQVEANCTHDQEWKSNRLKIVEAQQEVLRIAMIPQEGFVRNLLREKGILKRWETIITMEIGDKVTLMFYQGESVAHTDVNSQMRCCGVDFSKHLTGLLQGLKVCEQIVAEKILLKIAEKVFSDSVWKVSSTIQAERDSLVRQTQTMPSNCNQQ